LRKLDSKAFGKKPWEKTLNSKGQIFSTDFILACIVFLFILVLSITYSTEVANRITFLEEDNARNIAALNAANALIISPGNPGNWENLNGLNAVSSIGIAATPNEIHSGKLQKLVDLNTDNYGKVRNLLGLSKYDIAISVLRLQNRQSVAEFGQQPNSEHKVSAVNRIGFYNGEEVIVRLKVFEE